MELEFAQSGVLAPAEAVLVAPRKWVKRGWGRGGELQRDKIPLDKSATASTKGFCVTESTSSSVKKEN